MVLRLLLTLLGLLAGLLLATTVAARPLTGIVRDSRDGRPLSGATVTSGGLATRTDSAGRFSLEAGGENLRVRLPGYRRREVPATLPLEIELAPFSPKTIYLSFYGISAGVLRDPALELIDRTELNALAIDVKGDRGLVAFPSDIDLAHRIGAQQVLTIPDPRELIEELRGRGIYTIARIVVFKDAPLARSFPGLAVKTAAGRVWRDGEGLAWADPFREEVWDYNAAVAAEAARLGFDEIQLDYVRFPDRAGLRFSAENTEENRVAAIGGFLRRVREAVAPYNVFLAADIFGYSCWNRNDTFIGQRLEDLAPLVDYLSPMLYPSGFEHGIGPYRNPLDHPYEIVRLTLDRARERTGLDPVRFRPWLQAFRDYAFDRREFRDREIRRQIEACRDFGSNGWMLWNPANVYTARGLEPVEQQAGLAGASGSRPD